MQNKKKYLSYAAFGGILLYFVTMLIFIVSMGYGWVHNIMALLNSSDAMSTGQFVVRVAGVFLAPLGGVMGYIGV